MEAVFEMLVTIFESLMLGFCLPSVLISGDREGKAMLSSPNIVDLVFVFLDMWSANGLVSVATLS